MAKIWVESYGCSASFSDAEIISGMLVNGGHTLAGSQDESDLGLIVTCSVKDATANRMAHRIRGMSSKPLVVAGCLPKAEPHTVQKIAKNASLVAPRALGRTLHVVNETLRGNRTAALEGSDGSKAGLPRVRLNRAISIIQIASGCMSECSFCQTKLAKENLTSYRPGDIVRQARRDLSEGCREVWLTSTDNGCYGLDIGSTLPELVRRVAEVDGDFMVRVGMMNPMYMPRIKDALLDAYESPKVYKFIHVPVQSGSDRILAGMRRGHTSDTFRGIARAMRERFPSCTVSTDVIVGFPGETERDFEGTVDLLEETRPDIINLSRYSKRPGTEAADLPQISDGEIKRRSGIVAKMAERISKDSNERWIGWRGRVLFSERVDGRVRGRNMSYKSVFVDADADVGSYGTVKITKGSTHGLFGVVC